MLNRHPAVIAAAVMLMPVAAAADAGVTPEAVIAKVREAAALLAREGEAGLVEIDREGSPFIWEGTYVFAFDCARDEIVAHAVAESRHLKISTLTDANGKLYGPPLCEAAEVPAGSWVEYWWPKPIPDADGDGFVYSKEFYRKVSYMHAVEGQPYQVGAGIYNDTLSIAELDALAKK